VANVLDEAERHALRQNARTATLGALRAFGGEARREAIRGWALAHGGFTPRELAAPPPEGAAEKYPSCVDHDLSWALTDLKRDGLVENPKWSVWKLTAAAEPATASAVAAPVDAERLAELRAMPYRDYLRTPEWRRTRAAALVRAGNACSLDVTHTDRLEVHHRTYERVGAELVTDLVVLCHSCHQLHHKEYGLPRRDKPIAPARRQAATDNLTPVPAAKTSKRRRPSLLNARQKRKLGRGLRDLVLKVCMIAGVAGGFLWAVHHQYVSPKHLCDIAPRGHRLAKGATGGRVLGTCITNDLLHILLAWFIPIGVGLLIGVLVAVPLVLMIRLGRSPAR
jgi:hypothetical protein